MTHTAPPAAQLQCRCLRRITRAAKYARIRPSATSTVVLSSQWNSCSNGASWSGGLAVGSRGEFDAEGITPLLSGPSPRERSIWPARAGRVNERWRTKGPPSRWCGAARRAVRARGLSYPAGWCGVGEDSSAGDQQMITPSQRPSSASSGSAKTVVPSGCRCPATQPGWARASAPGRTPHHARRRWREASGWMVCALLFSYVLGLLRLSSKVGARAFDGRPLWGGRFFCETVRRETRPIKARPETTAERKTASSIARRQGVCCMAAVQARQDFWFRAGARCPSCAPIAARGSNQPIADAAHVYHPAGLAVRPELAPQAAGVGVDRAGGPARPIAPHRAQQFVLGEHALRGRPRDAGAARTPAGAGGCRGRAVSRRERLDRSRAAPT